jgi:hypothetical protein
MFSTQREEKYPPNTRLASWSAAWSGCSRGTAGSAMRSEDCTAPGRSTSVSGPGFNAGISGSETSEPSPSHFTKARSAAAMALSGAMSPTRTSVAPAGWTRSACSVRSAPALTASTCSGVGVCTEYGCRPKMRLSSATRARWEGWVWATRIRSVSRARSVLTSSVGYAASVSTSARMSSSRSSPPTRALPETSSRSGSAPADRPPPTFCSSAAMSTVDIEAVPDRIVWVSIAARARCAFGNGMRSRTSTSGTDERRTASTVRPLSSVRSTALGSLSARLGPSAGTVRVLIWPLPE